MSERSIDVDINYPAWRLRELSTAVVTFHYLLSLTPSMLLLLLLSLLLLVAFVETVGADIAVAIVAILWVLCCQRYWRLQPTIKRLSSCG